MASINSKEKPKAGCQLLYNLHGMHLVALSQRPPEISYILLCCAQMAAVFFSCHTQPLGRDFNR